MGLLGGLGSDRPKERLDPEDLDHSDAGGLSPLFAAGAAGMPRRPHLQTGKLLDVEFTVLIHIETREFRVHETHELRARDLAAFVGVHEYQQLIDLGVALRRRRGVRLRDCAGRCEQHRDGDHKRHPPYHLNLLG